MARYRNETTKELISELRKYTFSIFEYTEKIKNPTMRPIQIGIPNNVLSFMKEIEINVNESIITNALIGIANFVLSEMHEVMKNQSFEYVACQNSNEIFDKINTELELIILSCVYDYDSITHPKFKRNHKGTFLPFLREGTFDKIPVIADIRRIDSTALFMRRPFFKGYVRETDKDEVLKLYYTTDSSAFEMYKIK